MLFIRAGILNEFSEMIWTAALGWLDTYIRPDAWFFNGFAAVANAGTKDVQFNWPKTDKAPTSSTTVRDIEIVADFLEECPSEKLPTYFDKAGGAATLRLFHEFTDLRRSRYQALAILGKGQKKGTLQDKVARDIALWTRLRDSLKRVVQAAASSIPYHLVGRVLAAEGETVTTLARDIFMLHYNGWKSVCTEVKELAQGEKVNIGKIDLTNGDETMALVNSEEAARLRARWGELKDVQTMPADMIQELGIDPPVEIEYDDLDFVKAKIANIIGARALHRPLKATENRAKVIKQAILIIEQLAGPEVVLEPALGLALAAADPSEEGK